jgi:hypothetical protein
MSTLLRMALLLLPLALLTPGSTAPSAHKRPIALHPDNPHYFMFRGKPTVLITSAEHYGAVLNSDFDYAQYLKTLQADGMNLTRVFSGAYVEPPGAFNIRHNTLAPAEDRFLSPWRRSGTAGYAGGGAKFDLAQWNDAYWKRLRDFVTQAGKRGVVVEYVMFCPYYEEPQWAISPLNARNNVNGIGDVARTDVLAMKSPALQRIQEALVRKAVEELRGFDNVYFEICNEPYFGGVTLEWQRRIAKVIVDAEAGLPRERWHLIAQNIANGSEKIAAPDPFVSVFNFHYANPPDAVPQNYGLNKAIGFDETGFKGVKDTPYRTDAWEFMLAGGAVYNNLDYSFTVAHPDGTEAVTKPTPGGGGPALRRQLRTLAEFMNSVPFVGMALDSESLRPMPSDGVLIRALSAPGRAYAAYLRGGKATSLVATLPRGQYRARWLIPETGVEAVMEDVLSEQGVVTLTVPPYTSDLALRLTQGGDRGKGSSDTYAPQEPQRRPRRERRRRR